jgi:hypothetical protein
MLLSEVDALRVTIFLINSPGASFKEAFLTDFAQGFFPFRFKPFEAVACFWTRPPPARCAMY